MAGTGLPVAASAGWELTSDRVAKQPDRPWPCRPLDIIEAEMKDARNACIGL